MSNRLTIVIVTFNSDDVISDCLESLNGVPNILVVDNGSSDRTKNIVDRFKSVTLINVNDNLGYGAAANLGFSKVKTEFGLLMNPDIRLRQDAIKNLIQAADHYVDAGVLAPTIWEPNNHIQFGQRSFGRPLERVGNLGACLPQGDCCTVFLLGAALFFPMAKFNSIGGFDENIFLYYEDDDICMRMSKAGFSLIHVNSAHADHGAGKSTQKSSELEWWRWWHTGWSRAYMQKKYKGTVTIFYTRLPLYMFKAAGYRLLGNVKKNNQYSGLLKGIFSYLRGIKARDVRLPVFPFKKK